ncbi:hypothetical protein TNCV_5034221 [Trichonephila clavipes]|nr:hypothetical protein TNCV_5034221 [Trichonephila clavipes]
MCSGEAYSSWHLGQIGNLLLSPEKDISVTVNTYNPKYCGFCLLSSPRKPLSVRKPHSTHEPDVIRGVKKRPPHLRKEQSVGNHRRKRL